MDTERSVEHLLIEGREAAARHAWREARELLEAADAVEPLTASDAEVLARSAWWLGDLAACIAFRERAHRTYRKAGQILGAARVALDLSHDYLMKGDGAMGNGWRRRAERLLADQAPAPEHGYLERMRAGAAMAAGDLDGALEHAIRCQELGERFADPDLQALGLHEQGRILIRLGRAPEGLAVLDEAIVAAVSGELDPVVTGIIYCNAIEICRDLTDYARAGEWNDAAKRWCERMAVSGFPGICRVRRAEIGKLRGAWPEAEREARQAVSELKEWYVDVAAAGLYEIGEIRLRMGDFAAAEEAFRDANGLGHDPQPGLALLRLREGEVGAAWAAIQRSLAATSDADRLRRARLLPAAVEIALENGDVGAASGAAAELEAIAETFLSTALRAAATVARGRILLAEGKAREAGEALREGRGLWAEVDAPYEVAEARRLLGLAYREAGDEDGARLELEAALTAFETMGGVPDAARVAEELGVAERRAAPGRAVRTLMFTDIVGSTGLIEAIGDDAWSDLQRWHDETLRAAFAQHGGEEVDHAGDGFFVAFHDPASAIECAVAIQRLLAQHRRTSGFAPRVRIGIHTTEASTKPGGYGGRGVHEAARIGSLGGADEIVVSRGSLPEHTRFPVSEPRSAELKGIEGPVEVVTVDWRP
ncbi:MAG TPA: adenylate/guanylate cyclase domain-containing protein [Actinomycetota bacterium]